MIRAPSLAHDSLSPEGEAPEMDLSSGLSHLDGKTVVILKLSGWGSLLGIAPLLFGLRKKAPTCRLVLATHRRNAPVASRFPWPDTILYLDGASVGSSPPSLAGMAKLALAIRAQKPFLFLDLQLETLRWTSLFTQVASGASRRIGFVRRGDRLRMAALSHPLFFNRHHPSVRAYEQAALLLGLPPGTFRPEALEPALRESLKDHRELEEAVPSLRLPGKILVMNPNASERALERRWPRESFSRTAERLLRRHPSLRIVLTGSSEEREYTDRILHDLPAFRGRITNLAGRLSFGGLIALLRRADVFLSNDTGPLHLALCLGTPTVGLFGPTSPDLVLAPWTLSQMTALHEPLYCSPCLYQVLRPPCGGDNLCLSSLPVDRVVGAIESRLAGELPKDGRDSALSPPFRASDDRGSPLAGFRPDDREIRS